MTVLQHNESAHSEPLYARQLLRQLASDSLDVEVDEALQEELDEEENPHRSPQNLVEFLVPKLLRLPLPANEALLLHLLSSLLDSAQSGGK